MLDRAHAEGENTTFTPIFDTLLAEFALEWPDTGGSGDRNEWFEPLREPAESAD